MKEIFDLFFGNSPARRGNWKLKQGNFEGAIQEYNQALSYKYRGLTRIEMEDYSGSIEDLQKAAGLFFHQGQIAEHQEILALTKEIQSFSLG